MSMIEHPVTATLPPPPQSAAVRVLVTGSRNWPDSSAVDAALDFYLGLADGLTVIHGGAATGADRMASTWCALAGFGVEEEEHPALWSVHGLLAGPARNKVMVARGAFVCLAFIMPCSKSGCRRPVPHGSHGATHCADLAERSGITTVRVGE